MPYNPSSDFVGLWRAVSGGVEKAEMPGLDFVVMALNRAGILRAVTSQTPPTTNQSSTAWFKPSNPSFAGEGSLFLWDGSTYVPATPELFFGGSGGGGGGGSGMVIISSTPPVSPAAGTEWWNGSILQLWDGSLWKTIGPTVGPGGAPLQTTTGVFSLNQSTNLTGMTASAWVVVPFNAAPQIDTMGGWNATTFKYTPNLPGYYAVVYKNLPAITTGGGAAILKNDDGVFDGSGDTVIASANTSSAGQVLTATGFVQMNGTTDYVRCFAYSNGTLNGISGGPAFSLIRLP